MQEVRVYSFVTGSVTAARSKIIHVSWMTFEPPCYLALFAQYMWTDSHFCIRKHLSDYAKNISRHHIKISRLSDQSHMICASLVYAPGIMAYFAFDFSKSKIGCRRVCFLHFRRFAFLKSGIIRLTVLISYLFIDVDHEFTTAKRKTMQELLGKETDISAWTGCILLSTQIQDGTLVPCYSSGKSPALLLSWP